MLHSVETICLLFVTCSLVLKGMHFKMEYLHYMNGTDIQSVPESLLPNPDSVVSSQGQQWDWEWNWGKEMWCHLIQRRMKTKGWLKVVSDRTAILTEGWFWKLLSVMLPLSKLRKITLDVGQYLCALGEPPESNWIKCVVHRGCIKDA